MCNCHGLHHPLLEEDNSKNNHVYNTHVWVLTVSEEEEEEEKSERNHQNQNRTTGQEPGAWAPPIYDETLLSCHCYNHQGDPPWATQVASQISPTFRGRGCTTRESNPNGAADMGAVVDWRCATRTWCPTQHPTCPQPGFTLPRCQFVTLNRLRCGQARCAESLYRWGVIASPACPCGESHQTTRHIVEECPLTAFPGGLRRLHEAGPDAVEWLTKLSMKLWECSKRTTTCHQNWGY